MPDDPITYREADNRFASKEALLDLRTAIRSSEDRIMAGIEAIRKTVDVRHDDVESRLRIVEALAAKNEQRITAVEKPSGTVSMAQQIATSVVSSLLTAAVAGGLLYYALAGHHV